MFAFIFITYSVNAVLSICLVYIDLLVWFSLIYDILMLSDVVRLTWRPLSPVRQMERNGWWSWDPGPGPIRRVRRTGVAAPGAWTTAWRPHRSRPWAAVWKERERRPAPIALRLLPPPSQPLHPHLLLQQETPQPACLRWLLQWRKDPNPPSRPWAPRSPHQQSYTCGRHGSTAQRKWYVCQ